jgi:hypothetical protein
MRVDCPARELGELAFESYLAGLRDVGWPGDWRLARLGYSIAGTIPLAAIRWIREPELRAAASQALGRPSEEIIANEVSMHRYILDLADEARELLPLVG